MAWQAGGAEWIHLVDVDAAFGRGSNAVLLSSLIGELDVRVQLSGGIHDDVSPDRALGSGCARVVLATEALVDAAWCAGAIAEHGERIAVALDVAVVDGPDRSTTHRLSPRGRDAALDHSVAQELWVTLDALDRAGCARYIVTDVGRDGRLEGPNQTLCRSVAAATSSSVIASGGVASLDDLDLLAAARADRPNLDGAIVGRALTDGRFTLAEAFETVRRAVDGPPT